MMKTRLFLIPFILILNSCNHSKNGENLKNEIFQTEKAFERMAHEKGIVYAFYFFADDSAVIKRQNDTLITGKENIRTYYEKQDLKNAAVNWTPDFIEVSSCGDLGYTYGKYTWRIWNEKGDTTEYKGIFHTVWKQQDDGNWKYVWD